MFVATEIEVFTVPNKSLNLHQASDGRVAAMIMYPLAERCCPCSQDREPSSGSSEAYSWKSSLSCGWWASTGPGVPYCAAPIAESSGSRIWCACWKAWAPPVAYLMAPCNHQRARVRSLSQDKEQLHRPGGFSCHLCETAGRRAGGHARVGQVRIAHCVYR